VVYGAALEICRQMSQAVVLRSEQYFCISCPKAILKLKCHLVLARVAALVSKMLAKLIYVKSMKVVKTLI
jgi:hypothetical protein